jgi:catechol-2,3-dioxygenase
MPAIILNHVNFQASREIVEQLKEFYCSTLGLTAGYRPPVASFGYWLYAGELPVLHLSEEKPGDHRSVNLRPTFHHVAFTCTKADEMEAHLVKHGIQYRCSRVPGNGALQIFFQDPAGNGVELSFPIQQSGPAMLDAGLARNP